MRSAPEGASAARAEGRKDAGVAASMRRRTRTRWKRDGKTDLVMEAPWLKVDSGGVLSCACLPSAPRHGEKHRSVPGAGIATFPSFSCLKLPRTHASGGAAGVLEEDDPARLPERREENLLGRALLSRALSGKGEKRGRKGRKGKKHKEIYFCNILK